MARIEGTDSADSLVGTSEDDVLVGKAGNDDLFGGAGDDELFGGFGNDRFTGGRGADRFNLPPGPVNLPLATPMSTETFTDFNFEEGDRIVINDLRVGSFTELSFEQLGDNVGIFSSSLVFSNIEDDFVPVEPELKAIVNNTQVEDVELGTVRGDIFDILVPRDPILVPRDQISIEPLF